VTENFKKSDFSLELSQKWENAVLTGKKKYKKTNPSQFKYCLLQVARHVVK